MPHLNIKALKLRDYRCFETLDIDFHERLTVLVAVNGAGKTSILDAIAVAFGPFIGAFDEAVGKHFESSDIRQYKARETTTREMEYAPEGVSLEACGYIPTEKGNGSLDGGDTTWRRTRASAPGAKTTIKYAKALIKYGKQLQKDVRTPGKQVILPLVSYYGTGRLWQQKKLTEKKNVITWRTSGNSRTTGYTDCLDPASSYKAFANWFHYLSFNATNARIRGQQAIQAEFEGYILSINKAVNTCLAPVGWKDIEYSFNHETLIAHHEQFGELPIELLSDGIRNLIGMVADIAYRATKLNGHLGANAAQQTPGIVLIDEVDMHLHPEWQQVVLQNLTQAFPQMQFIVTTHSPQVLTTVSRDHIRVLRATETGFEVSTPDFSPLAHESGDALAKVMGTHREPALPMQDDIRRYEQLVRIGQEGSPDAQQLRLALEQNGYQFHESDLATWRFLASHISGNAG